MEEKSRRYYMSIWGVARERESAERGRGGSAPWCPPKSIFALPRQLLFFKQIIIHFNTYSVFKFSKLGSGFLQI